MVRGGKELVSLLPKALEGRRQIGVLGWGSQGRPRPRTLGTCPQGTAVKVKVGLRPAFLLESRPGRASPRKTDLGRDDDRGAGIRPSNNGTDTNITYGKQYGKFNEGALFNCALSSRIVNWNCCIFTARNSLNFF